MKLICTAQSIESSTVPDLLQPNRNGLYCEAGGFYIDPWNPVDRTVITHAHSDHARPGSTRYLCAASCAEILKLRIGNDASIQPLKFDQSLSLNDVRISFHPAGHVLGSAQVRIEHKGNVWVASGDYKLQADPTCEPFEPVQCDVFITESTFGLPIYRWRNSAAIFDEINQWWKENQQRRRASVIFGYALGKAQRLLAGVNDSIGPIIVHGAIARFLPAYEAAGIKLPQVLRADPDIVKQHRSSALVIAPPSAANTPWLKKFGRISTAIASGWMQVRGTRRRRNVDRGFVLSDHADWPGLLHTIRATKAQRIITTHGFSDVFARYLHEIGVQAHAWKTQYSDAGEEENDEPTVEVHPTDAGTQRAQTKMKP